MIEFLVAANVFFASQAIAGQFPELTKGGCVRVDVINEYLCWAPDDHAGGISEGNNDYGNDVSDLPDRQESNVGSPPSSPPSRSYDKPDRDKPGHHGKSRGKDRSKGKGKGYGKKDRDHGKGYGRGHSKGRGKGHGKPGKGKGHGKHRH